MNLFVDTNVFLSFYHLSSEDLEELKKLIVLLEQKKIVLHLPTQVRDEFHRNRETKNADALKRLQQQPLPNQFPQTCKDYPEYQVIKDAIKQYKENLATLVNKLSVDIEAKALHADRTIKELFLKATRIDSSTNIENARLRVDLGNPPGKNGSLGDALNWESLLNSVPNNEDLYLVSEDSDYCSPLREQLFNLYLSAEWKHKKNSAVHFYKKLSHFFKEKYPEIKLASELAKDSLIEELQNSGSFSETHLVVAKLRRYTDFTDPQAKAILSATLANHQVGAIAGDSDLRALLTDVVRGREEKMEPEAIQYIQKKFAEE